MSTDANGLDWLRKIRESISSECGNDSKIMGEYFRNIQKRYGKRILRDEIDAGYIKINRREEIPDIRHPTTA